LISVFSFARGDRIGRDAQERHLISPRWPLPTSQTTAAIYEAIRNAHHRHLVPIEFMSIDATAHRIVVVRPFYARGSIKDLIYGSDPKTNVVSKYEVSSSGRMRIGTPLAVTKIVHFATQILDALLFLSECRIPYVHLSTRNVLVDANDLVRLDGLENSLLGLAFPLQSLVVPALLANHDPARADSRMMIQMLNVIQFGYLVYEMYTGRAPSVPWPTSIPCRRDTTLFEVICAI
jgi:hypothetical protein